MVVSTQNFLLFIRPTFLIVKRFRGKINIQRPQQPHYEKSRVLAVTTPTYDNENIKKHCFAKNNNLFKMNPYNNIIASEVSNWLKNSKMITIFHLNSISADELFKVKVDLYKQNMHLKSYGKKIIEKAVENTKFEEINQLFHTNHCIVFSTNENVHNLIKITKKVPQMVLLAGIVHNRLLSRNEFVEFSKLPELKILRTRFVNVLNTTTTNFITSMQNNQTNLVNILKVFAETNS